MIKQYFAIFVLFIAAYLAKAQECSIEMSISNKDILIGEQSILSIEYKNLAENAIIPLFGDTLMNEVEILQVTTDTQKTANGLFNITSQLTLTSFEAGFYPIKPIKIKCGEDSIESKPLLLSVTDIPIDSIQGITDIKPAAQVSISFWEYIIIYQKILWSILVILLLLGLALFYLRSRKKTETPVVEPIKPLIPAEIIALEKLNLLKDKKLWQNNQTKSFYSEISEILREYLENQFKIRALELTTDEILINLRWVKIEETQKENLKNILRISDLVKFAKEKPLGDENERALQLAFDFVNNTVPKVEQSSQTEKNERKEELEE